MPLLDRTLDLGLAPVADAALDEAGWRAVQRLLHHEAALLDGRQWAAWLALWHEDGRYWVPRFEAQADPFGQVSLFFEDRMLRELRVRRLENPRNWSQQPPTRASRLVGNLEPLGRDAQGRLIVRSVLHCVEWRLQQRVLAGTVHHKLAPTAEGGWQLWLKRVDLVNSDDVLGNLEVFL